MRVSKETIQELQDNGITIKFYPCSANEYWNQRYEYQYKHYLNYHKGMSKVVNGRLVDVTQEELIPQAKEWAEKYSVKDLHNWYDADSLFIAYEDTMFVKKEATKSKEITVTYILKLVEKNKKQMSGYYGEFTKVIQQLAKKQGWKSWFAIYPTTYGIGVDNFWASQRIQNSEKISILLDAANIEYTNEFSQKYWVYRFRISKKQENIDKLKKLL